MMPLDSQHAVVRVLITMEVIQASVAVAMLAREPAATRLAEAVARRPLLADGLALAEVVEAVTEEVSAGPDRGTAANFAVLTLLYAAESVEGLATGDPEAPEALARFTQAGLQYVAMLSAAPRELRERLQTLHSAASGA